MSITAKQKEQLNKLAEEASAHAAARAAARTAHLETMPELSRTTIEPYMNWLARNAAAMDAPHLAACLNLAELTVRLHMGDAQAKDTQHTLVRDGVMEAPQIA